MARCGQHALSELGLRPDHGKRDITRIFENEAAGDSTIGFRSRPMAHTLTLPNSVALD
jgi:hypothetical protein